MGSSTSWNNKMKMGPKLRAVKTHFFTWFSSTRIFYQKEVRFSTKLIYCSIVLDYILPVELLVFKEYKIVRLIRLHCKKSLYALSIGTSYFDCAYLTNIFGLFYTIFQYWAECHNYRIISDLTGGGGRGIYFCIW